MTSEAEQIKARRSALKRKNRSLYDHVAEILFRIDPAGINFEENTDEYHTETDTILPRLASCETALEVRAIVIEEFTRWFDADAVSKTKKNKFDEIAAEIWSAFQVFRRRNLLPTNTEQAGGRQPPTRAEST